MPGDPTRATGAAARRAATPAPAAVAEDETPLQELEAEDAGIADAQTADAAEEQAETTAEDQAEESAGESGSEKS